MAGKILLFEGLIGSGKSTLTRSLARHLEAQGVNVVLYPEQVPRDFLNLFLQDIPRYAYCFELFVAGERQQLLERAKQDASAGKCVLLDRGLIGDLAFTQMLHAANHISDRQLALYKQVFSQPLDGVHTCVYLDCVPATAFAQMQERGISSEIASYTLEYFERLATSYENALATHSWTRLAPMECTVVDGLLPVDVTVKIAKQLGL